MDIIIENIILHILDSNSKYPVFSQENLNLDNEKVHDFIGKHIGRIFIDQDTKTGGIPKDSEVADLVRKIDENFLDGSISMAGRLYEIMKKYLEIPSGDLLIGKVKFEQEDYIVIVKFNYRDGYTHYVDYGEEGTLNKIVINKVMLPSELQRNIEAAAINIRDLSLRVLEREYSIEGQKNFYFSKMFLCSDTDLSIKESIKVIRNVAKEITKEHYDNDFDKVSSIKEAIYNNLDSGSIGIEDVANTVFKNNLDLRKEYIERVEEAGVKKVVDLRGSKPEKRLSVHKLKMDNGISLDIPVDIYRDKDIMEFVNNPDGTISLLIKNIGKMKQGI